MTKEITNNQEKHTDNTSGMQPEVEKGSGIKVTSDIEISFSLGWGIHAGEILDLPLDESAQEVILSNHHIKIIK